MASFNFSELKITEILKTGWRRLEESKLPWEQNFIKCVQKGTCQAKDMLFSMLAEIDEHEILRTSFVLDL